MFTFVRTNEYGVRFYRNLDTDVMYAQSASGMTWWADFDGSGMYMTKVAAPESSRLLEN